MRSNGLHIKVIWGHFSGQKKSVRDQKSKIIIQFNKYSWYAPWKIEKFFLIPIMTFPRSSKVKSEWSQVKWSQIWSFSRNVSNLHNIRLRIWCQIQIKGYLRSIQVIKGQTWVKCVILGSNRTLTKNKQNSDKDSESLEGMRWNKSESVLHLW